MIRSSCEKIVWITPPAAISDNATLTTTTVDTLGFDYCHIYVGIGATDIGLVSIKVQESANSNGSSGSDITGCVVGTSANSTGSTSSLFTATDDDTFPYVFEIDCRNKKRYLDVSCVTGNGTNGTYIVLFAILSRAEETPTSPTQRGVGQILRG